MTEPRIRHIIRLVALLLIFMVNVNEGNAQLLSTNFPSSFRNTKKNELGNARSLATLFRKVKQGKTIKVMHIGDSHVKGNYLPKAVGSTLQSYFPRLEFAYYGINGAWARRFYENDMVQRVADEHPDLVIVSFGTNEAHGAVLDERAHAATMDQLTGSISARCPGVLFLFTTPPGSYIAQRTGSYTTGRGRYRRTHYTSVKAPNHNTERVANSIVRYCNSHNHAVWDIFEIAGGSTNAFSNWRDAGLMAADQVHYSAQAYILQGKLLGEAIHKAYLHTPVSGSQTRMMHAPTPQEQKPYKSVKGF